MDVLKILKNDHDSVKALFAKFEKAGPGAEDRKWELFEQIRRELTIHSKAEEEIFYPAIKVFNGEGRRLITEAVREHREMDQGLTRIGRLNVIDARFDDRLAALMEDVEHHITQEEGQIFQFAQENCPVHQLEELGAEIEKRKTALERQLAA